MQEKTVNIEKLKELLEKGTELGTALEQIGEERASYVIKQLDSLNTRANTRSCSLADQYCGCNGM